SRSEGSYAKPDRILGKRSYTNTLIFYFNITIYEMADHLMLTFTKLKMWGTSVGPDSSLPSVVSALNVQTQKKIKLDESNELFIDLGRIKTIYPYRQQNNYSRKLDTIETDAAILENKYIRAVFLPGYGGRLWQLYDKTAGRDLLYINDCIRPCNLALRNAWISGGIEWNIGMIGHSPFTCSPLFTVKVTGESGVEVLRMYEYERIRNVVYQMDFFLKEDSDKLYCRFRIVNLNYETIPMYWWSNIAAPEREGSRLVVPAEQSYYSYLDFIGKTSFPLRKNYDASYPNKTKCAMDYFFYIPDERRKYIAYFDNEGKGFYQTSTKRLRGRKLFVWGQTDGSLNWQDFLTDKGGPYCELQAGLGRTQYECIPMPPMAAWEWMEVYSPVTVTPEQVDSDWSVLQNTVERTIEEDFSETDLERMLEVTRQDFVYKKGDLVHEGSPFGYYENMLRHSKGEEEISGHLEFTDPPNDAPGIAGLLKSSRFAIRAAHDVPADYLCGERWKEVIRDAALLTDKENWYTHYIYGMLLLDEGAVGEAQKEFHDSLKLTDNPWSHYGLFACGYNSGKSCEGIDHLKIMLTMLPYDLSAAREAFKYFCQSGEYKYLIGVYNDLASAIKEDGRVRFYLADAYAKSGFIEKAESILYENRGLIVPDIREGETTITDLWEFIERTKADDGAKLPEPPKFLNFRMSSDE
ncbi:MAG: DUF5107 domain-containing protein, partial [Saccharofermentanales bacterium]